MRRHTLTLLLIPLMAQLSVAPDSIESYGSMQMLMSDAVIVSELETREMSLDELQSMALGK